MLSRLLSLLGLSMRNTLIYCSHIDNTTTFVMKTNTIVFDLLFKAICSAMLIRGLSSSFKSYKYLDFITITDIGTNMYIRKSRVEEIYIDWEFPNTIALDIAL